MQSLSADLFLLHAPSVYDFRERDDLLFAYLSDSDSVNITSIYEMYPIGFLTLKSWLQSQGFRVEIVNLASIMLMHPDVSVEKLLGRLEAPVFGLDLHWMAQCHGAIEVAKIIKAIHPDSLVMFGGISATYFAEELIGYQPVDMVVKGYDTLEPVLEIMRAVSAGSRSFEHVPNLLYKQRGGQVQATGFTHKPLQNYNNARIDWSFYKQAVRDPLATPLVMTLPNSGCSYNCTWCGGSNYAYKAIMGVNKTLITKDHRLVVEELQTLGDFAPLTSIYALQCYSESKARLHEYLDAVRDRSIKSVFFEQFHLTEPETLKKMAASTQAYVLLSPESHDLQVGLRAGRGNYTMAEMEAWIERALDLGIAGVFVWFMIGMPQQTPESVMETVAYSEALLKKFRGKKVYPLICPMVPFLDPGSQIFENPDKFGYRLFHKTLEEHRRAMVEPVWYRRLNYETRWMSRQEMQQTTYEAVARLTAIKRDLGILPPSVCAFILDTIDETQDLLHRIESALVANLKLPTSLRAEILAYNRKILTYSTDQIIPMPRPFGGRWFDDFTVPESLLRELEHA